MRAYCGTRHARSRLTTSYPRHEGDIAGAFVRDAVQHLRAAGVEVKVVSPAGFRDFGIAYGDGIAANLRSHPARAALLPAFLASYAHAARRAAQDADLVHAHWLPSGFPALATGKPFVLQAWGTDVELAARAPALFRPLVRRARVVVAPSSGGQRGVDATRSDRRQGDRKRGRPARIPRRAGGSTPGALRRSAGSGERDRGAGAGDRGHPARDRRRRAAPAPRSGCRRLRAAAELRPYYERAAIVVCPSRREGYGVVAREAMAHGRPVVASAVGGLLDAVEHERTGLLVPPGDAGSATRCDRATAGGRDAAGQARGGSARARRRALLVGGGHGRDARRLRGCALPGQKRTRR